MKRICHLTSVHQWNDIRIFRKECISLASHGFETYLIATDCEDKKVNGVNIVSAGPKPLSRLKRMTQLVKAVYKKAVEIDADVYHFHDPELLFVGWLLKKKGKKVIYDTHEDVPRQIMSKPWIWKPLQRFISFTFETVENFIAARITAVMAATTSIGDRFLGLNKNTIVIHNYPLLQELQSTTAWENKRQEICYAGGISEIRGIKQLIEALAHAPAIKLHLVGSFSSDAFRNEMTQLPGWRQVIEHGFVERTRVAEIFGVSKVGMVALLKTPNHFNSQPIKMFEYMSAGIPVIASHFPLWREIIEGNTCGLCVDPTNPKAIADAIIHILSHDEEAKRMGENGRKAVEEKYNWETEEKKLVEFYYRLLS